MADRKWWTLTVVSLATFMLLLDITIVNVALPAIQRSLTASFSDLQWVVDAYALTLSILLLVSGSVADRIGRRMVFVSGLIVFSVRLARVRPRAQSVHAWSSPAPPRESAGR